MQVSSHTAISRALPHSGSTIKSWILEHFAKAKLAVQRSLEGANVVHFSFDLWSSPNHRAFLGVVAHWVDSSGHLHSLLLGLRRFLGAHTGANQAAHFWEVAEDFKITRKLGYFTLDNATNNDSALAEIAAFLSKIGIVFDPVKRRLRCFGHVINLVVKSFLWGKDVEAFQYELAGYDEKDEDQELKQIMEWRKRGAMGKLHNICVWICRTPQRRDAFEEKARQQVHNLTNATTPIVGCITRWGGDYDALKRAFLLRDPIEEFVASAIRNNAGEVDMKNPHALCYDELSHDDWEELRSILHILEPFKAWSLRLQGKCKNGSLYELFPAMDELLSHLEEAKSLYADPALHGEHLRGSINSAWAKLDK